ncbi:MAG: hypothetical protein K2K48_05780 [Anaeroplasmataceae bacterium]|nr:hypothetical protein [Anaeroplasmataceae bacterium]
MELVLREYEEIENLTKKDLKLEGELKSTTFKRKFFKNGFVTMDLNCKKFYTNLFMLILKYNLKFQVGCISKTEYLVFQFANALVLPSNIIIGSFTYSLTKFIEQHRLYNLFQDLIKGETFFLERFKVSLIQLLCKVLEEIKGVVREEKEENAIKQLIQILMVSQVKVNKSICKSWNYDIIAEAIKLRIGELNKKDVTVIIDKEPLTYEAFLNSGVNAEECDSKKSLGIRMTDMFIGFIGRFIYYLKSDVHEQNYKRLSDIKKKDFVDKRLINNNWFNLKEEEFYLIKQIAEFFNQSTYWSAFTLYYMDDITTFFNYFHYIMQYKDYNEFCKNKDMHNEYFNSYACEYLLSSYKNLNKQIL